MDSRNITYRLARRSDAKEIVTLFNIATPKHARSVQYWHWSNSDVPWGQSLAAVAQDNHMIVAHYSIMPVDFVINNKIVRLGFGQQAVVHPNFRNLEIIKVLSDLILKKAQGRFLGIYAYPNDNFFTVKKMLLGWREVEIFTADVIQTKDLPAKKEKKIAVKSIDVFPKIDWLSQRGSGVSISKSTVHLNWRFFSHPINHYTVLGAYQNSRMIGYLVLKIYFQPEDHALVGHFIDFDVRDKDVAILSPLVSGAKEFFEFNGIEKIVFWNRDKDFRAFFEPFVSAQGFKTNMAVHLLAGTAGENLYDKENWSITMASSDAF